MLKKFIGTSILLSLLVALSVPVLAQTTNTPTTNAPANVSKKTLDLPCIQAAVEKRDNAIIVAFDAFHVTVKSALETRRDALKAAWGITDRKERRAAIRKAWKEYGDAVRKARSDLRKARLAAWKLFYTERKACGTSAVSDDTTGSGVDAQL